MPDVIVAGGGTAGCVVAARLAEAGRSVLLLEAGEAAPPPELRSATSLAGSVPGHPATWSFPGHLTPDRPFTVARGRVLGGSSAVNGAYFARATPDDYGWAPGWAYADLLPYFRALETDHDFAGPAHGDAGPMPVTRPSGDLLSPAAEAFLAACRALGHPDEPDKNAGGVPGAGPVPANVRDGVRVSTAAAYLGPGVAVTERAVVRRVVVERGRAVGVEADVAGVPTVLHADEVVLSAGAINTAHLLLLSGIGPAADLRAHAIPVVRDTPVGTTFHDHPQIWLPYRTTRPLPVHPGMLLTQAALDTPHAELLATGVPMPVALSPAAAAPPAPSASPAAGGGAASARSRASRGPASGLPAPPAARGRASGPPAPHLAGGGRGAALPAARELALIVGLQRPEARGRLSLASADPGVPPRLEYRYLEPEADRKRLLDAVRHGLEVLRTPPMRELVASVGVPDDVDGAWLRANLQTAFHLSGTAPIGAVTDEYGRVHGVEGLRVADTALIPAPMRRGPAATAVLIGERIASFARVA